MAPQVVKRLQRPLIWPVVSFLVLLLVALHLMSDAVEKSAELSRFFVPLLAVSVIGLVALAGLIAGDLIRLTIRYRQQAAGSRLTGRMIFMFAVLSLVPVSVVYYYSLGFLLKGIDSWFDVEIDQAMENALELSKSSLGLNQRVLLKYTEELLNDIVDQSETALALSLDQMRSRAGASELALMNTAGRVFGSSNADPTVLVPDKPNNEVIQQLRDGTNYVGLVPRGEDDLQIRVLVNDPRGRPLMLQALYPTSEHVSGLTGKLEEAYNRYQELSYLRQSLQFSFSLTLSLVLIFGLLTALWAAIVSARRLVAPVTDIAEGTRAVAAGDYDKQLPLPKHADELRFLVASFNTMTRRIAQARDEADQSRREVESQRSYLETVLGKLSSGVMAFDSDLTLRTANPAAHQILRVDLAPYMDKSLKTLGEENTQLQQFVGALSEPLSEGDQEWRGEVALVSGEGRQVLMCRITPFSPPGSSQGGQVLVFDDITALIKAQRDAAWGEVARRLAHEIKNPLTPIQLSAERLRHKYLGSLPADDARVLDRSTHTIVQQVEAMKAMVNAFSDYARPPKMQPEPVEADQLISEVMDLYAGGGSHDRIQVRLAAEGAFIEADPVRLRQVVHNLIKNSQEATAKSKGGRITLETRFYKDDDRPLFELCVEDNGPGFEEEMLGQLFEPYVTTKAKGTGLGLAIVKKIVEEHGGSIWAENSPGGARVVVRLPLSKSGRKSSGEQGVDEKENNTA